MLSKQEKKYYAFLSKHKSNRKLLYLIKFLMLKIRRLGLPIYKNIYDNINMHSYYLVLERLLKNNKEKSYFEWGPGINTDLAKKYMNNVYSVEHDKKWFDIYSKNYELIYSPISETSSNDYPKEIKKIDKKIDIAFVDGRCRTECIQNCKEAGVPLIVMHDSLHIVPGKYAFDGAPPAHMQNLHYYTSFTNYEYFIEIADLRTIILLDNKEKYEKYLSLFSDYYTNHGETINYKNISIASDKFN